MRGMLPLVLIVATGLGLVAIEPARADAPTVPTPPSIPTIGFEKYALANGLEVILHVDHSLPLVAVNIWYHVGPAHEPRGRSGFAHLFEHLMFEGSEHVGAEFDSLLESAGASNVNGTTSWDRTNYFATVPREHLELVLWLESDRMGFLRDTLTQARFLTQRRVVENERRQSYDNAPYGPSSLALLDTLFPPGHPYHGTIIGSFADLAAADLADVRRFYDAYYAPGNATLCVAGDFEVQQTKRQIARYFGSLPARATPKSKRAATRPLRKAKRLVIEEPVELAKVSMGWIVPPAYSNEDLALDLASIVLAGGKAARLYRALVVEQSLASEVNAYVDSNELCGMVVIHALAASGTPPKQVERALDAELARLAHHGPTARELRRAQRRRLLDLLSEVQELCGEDGESGRAGLLQHFNHYVGDPGYLETYVKRLRSVSPAAVKRAVTSYLRPDARVVVITAPQPSGVP